MTKNMAYKVIACEINRQVQMIKRYPLTHCPMCMAGIRTIVDDMIQQFAYLDGSFKPFKFREACGLGDK